MFEMFFCAVVGVWAEQFFRSQEYYLFANDGENHTNNVKMLEEINKQDWTTTRCFCRLFGHVLRLDSPKKQDISDGQPGRR